MIGKIGGIKPKKLILLAVYSENIASASLLKGAKSSPVVFSIILRNSTDKAVVSGHILSYPPDNG